MIEIDEVIHVQATPEEVWAVLSNPYEVVGCVGDAEITQENEDGSYDGRMTLRFGPMRVKFQARVGLELDDAARSGVITARGKDGQGGTRMKTSAAFGLQPNETTRGTTISLKGDVELSGRLASQIEAAAGVVVRKMTADFTNALETRLNRSAEDGAESTGVTETAQRRGIFRRK